MPEKIKITKKELADIYDIDDEKKEEKEESHANATFDEYTETYDKKQEKEFLEDG